MANAAKDLEMTDVFINPDTGEVVTVEDIIKRVKPAKSTPTLWSRFSAGVLFKASKKMDDSLLTVLSCAMKETYPQTNEFKLSRDQLAQEAGVGRTTVTRAFDQLYEGDLIRHVSRSRYMLNPYLSTSGPQYRVADLCTKFDSLNSSSEAGEKQ